MWSYILFVVTVLSLVLITNKRREGFLIGACNELIWIAWAVFDQGVDWGFILFALTFGYIHIRGFVKWGEDEAAALEPAA